MKWSNILRLIAIVSVTLFAGCRQKRDEVKIGYMPYSSNLPFFVAQEKGFFAEEGLQVRAVRFGSSKEAMDALLTGKIHAECTIGLSTLLAIEAASPGQIKFCLPCVETEGRRASCLLVKKGAGISVVSDLRGKRIGTYTGTTQLLYLRLLLKNLGLDPEKDVTVIQVSPQLEIEAFATGQFDALYTIEPSVTIAIERGIGEPLVENPRNKYVVSPFPAGAIPFSSKFLKEHPLEAKGIYKGMDRAVTFIRKNEDEAKKLVSKYTGLEEGIATKAGIYEWWRAGEMDVEVMQKLADLLFENGEIQSKVSVGEMLLSEDDLPH